MTDPQPESDALEPQLTAFDRRVLAALEPWPETRAAWDERGDGWRNEWQVAEALRHDDVREIRAVLRGLARFHYAVNAGVGRQPTRWRRDPAGKANGVLGERTWRCEACGATTGRYDNGTACEACVMLAYAEHG